MVTLIAVVFGAMILRMAYLEIVRYHYYDMLAQSQHWSASEIPATRGTIYIQDALSNIHYPVAIDAQENLLYVVPKQITDPGQTAERIAKVIGQSAPAVQKMFSYSPYYVIIQHHLNATQSNMIKNMAINGVYLQPEDARVYPEGSLASQVIGFVNQNMSGQYGLERSLNGLLAGKAGFLKSERDSSGVPIVSGEKVDTAPKNGDNIVLTIDRNVQLEIEEKLQEAVQKYHPDSASIVVMDPSTGAVLGMANTPTYDPNNYSKVTDYTTFNNAAVDSTFEPGSIFKAITASAAIDSGKVQPTSTFNDPGYVIVQGQKINDAEHHAFGKVTMTQVLEQSLNDGTVYMLSQMGPKTYYSYLQKFGLGQPTGIEFDDEASGTLRPLSDYQQIDLATTTFGQGISVTPLQILTDVSAIANGGKLMQPHIISEIDDPNTQTAKITTPKVVRRVISQTSAQEVTQMLTSVVDDGLGKPAAIPGYDIAGKTGTAQIPTTDGKGYEPDSQTIGSFIGYAPATHPKFAMLVELVRPKGVAWAESSAAPLWGQIAQSLLNYYQIPPDR